MKIWAIVAGIGALMLLLKKDKGEGPSGLRWENVTGTAYLSWTGSDWNAVRFQATVYNDGEAPFSSTFTLMRNYNGIPTSVNDQMGVPITVAVTMAVGASNAITKDSGAYSTAFPVGGTCKLWLEDSLGNKSPVVTVGG